MLSLEADLAILMPKISDNARFTTRYAGLSEELDSLGVSHFFADSHKSYDEAEAGFTNVFDITRRELGDLGIASVTRDLTMALDDKPLYGSGTRVVHHPEVNRFLANKSNLYLAAPDIHPTTALVTADTIQDGLDQVPGERVVVKPVQGMLSKGVHVIPKLEAARLDLPAGGYMVSEFIDTSRGIPHLGIEGVHNLRVISISGMIIGGIARVRGDGGLILRNDIYGAYVGTDELPESMCAMAETIHSVMAEQPGDNQNVLAFDFMRGDNANGETVDVLCEANRRPMRVSRYNLGKGNLDETAISKLATDWDKAEAKMLAGMVG